MAKIELVKLYGDKDSMQACWAPVTSDSVLNWTQRDL